MRVISGWLGGRLFESPHGHRTHPMSEKMRGAIFGVLGDIKGLTALDAFSGSGAVGIESVSRGAKFVLMIELDKNAQTIIEENIVQLGIEDRAKSIRSSVKAWSTRHQLESFDLIFADPPYDSLPFKDLKLLPRHLADAGTLVLSWPGNMKPLSFEGLEVVQAKDYGDGQLVFYQKIR